MTDFNYKLYMDTVSLLKIKTLWHFSSQSLSHLKVTAMISLFFFSPQNFLLCVHIHKKKIMENTQYFLCFKKKKTQIFYAGPSILQLVLLTQQNGLEICSH